MKIMVVDNHEDTRMILETTFEAEGHTVKTAANGKEALEAAGAFLPDAIISDILMPVMDGFQLCREIRADGTLKDTHFIFYTSTYRDPGDEELAMRLGADAFLVKPMEQEEFIRAVQDVMETDVNRGRGATEPEERILKLYNERLVMKLEKKMLDLEEEIARRREAEERYKKLVEASPSGILVSQEGDVVFCNPEAMKIFGATDPEQLIGKTIWDLVHPDYREVAKKRAEQIMGETKPAPHMEQKYIGLDGRVIDVETTGTYIDYQGKASLLSMFRDVTDRKKSAEALRESEEKYRQLFDRETDAIMVFDAKTRVFEEANRACLDLYGYEKDEFLKLTTMDISAQSDDTADALQNMTEGKTPGMIPFRYQRKKDGTVFPVEITSGEFVVGGRRKIIGAVRDITERMRMERQLRQAQKMEAIGTLAGGIAHDFNNILTSVIGYTELIMQDAAKGSSLHDNLEEVLRAGMRARDLVRQILAFSRQSEEEARPIQMSLIVKEVLKLIRSSIPSMITIRQHVPTGLPPIMADPTQIHQVVMNLCTNAAHAMEDSSGELNVDLSQEELSPDDRRLFPDLDPGRYLKLVVSDTGYGIDPDDIGQIFDPYFTTKEKGEGTGLGLSVVHGIVKSIGGDIAVSSEPGKGATFTVYIPAIEKDAPPDASGPPEPLPTGSESILFVDDEPSIAALGKRLIESLGYDLTVRTSSIEALELFRAKPGRFDLIITDMTMPQMRGDKLALELMTIKPDVPVILCTGYSKMISKEQVKQLGIKGFVMKPFVVGDMAATIRNVLDSGPEG